MIGILLIGDELLSGQVKDKNLNYMLDRFFQTGHHVSEIRFVADKVEQISKAILELSQSNQFLITSGGIGPTHDDRTIISVTNAFNVKLKRNHILEEYLRFLYKEKITDDALAMADLPDSAELLNAGKQEWPIVKVRNCFILPGVPSIFREKFDHLLEYLPKVKQFYFAHLFVQSDEVFFAKKLSELNQKYQEIEIGSYPMYKKDNYYVQITLRHLEKKYVNTVFSDLEQYFREAKLLISSVKASRSKERNLVWNILP